MLVHAIGTIYNDVKQPTDTGWGDVVSRVVLKEEYAPGLLGLEQYSHIMAIYWMHTSAYDVDEHLVRHPRENTAYPKVGIFAQRARHRPNPIGINPALILEIKPSEIIVKGLDAINETPLLDLKPYVPIYDSVPEARIPEWIARLLSDYFH